MRDYILVFINGKEHRLSGEDVFLPITDYLRKGITLCGTKVVCAEGDCGACTVMLGRLSEGHIEYKPVNACILYGYQLDGSHIVTVEGLKVNGALNPVQKAMVDCHGAQCGYCTPGFIVAMAALFEEDKEPLVDNEVRDGLTGNLCRCTGYESIVKAGMEVDTSNMKSVKELFDEKQMVESFSKTSKESVLVEHDGMTAMVPANLDEFIEARSKYPKAKIVSGGTDLSVQLNKKMFTIETVISTSNLTELEEITTSESNGVEFVEVGARATLAELESYLLRRNPDLDYIFWVFGSPQIRNSGTLVGNIANGSPIADTVPYLFVMDGQIVVQGKKGRREIPITELYEGYKKMSLKDDEVIVAVRFSLPASKEILKLYKVSRRQHLDISAFTAAIRLEMKDGMISKARVAYGGVAATVVRLPEVEEFLVGKKHSLETFEKAGALARKMVEPLSDVRGSRQYRLQLAENIMSKFFYETAKEEELACL